MPYNTTAIPPRKEVTGQTQLPLTRVKKIVAVDPDIAICSNNAAFAITLATELFIQHLADQAQNEVKLERKPRRNIQYKDLANAVLHHDNLEFLEDIVPKTATLRQVKDQAAATRAKLRGETNKNVAANGGDDTAAPSGKKQKTMVNGSGSSPAERGHKVNGGGSSGTNALDMSSVLIADEDPSAQLELEMRQANQGQVQRPSAPGGDEDVDMTGTG